MVRPGKAAVDLLTQNGGCRAGLRQTISRHLDVKSRWQQAPSGAVFQTVEHLPHDAETRWHQPGGVTGVDAFGQHLNLEDTTGHAAQAGRQPKLVIVARPAVQADHQTHVTQAGTQHVHVGQQVVRATFFTGLDQAHDPGMGRPLRLQGLYGRDAGVDGIAIVRAASAVQLAVLPFGCPGAEIAAPAVEFRLLVEMTIHQHGLATDRGWLAMPAFAGGHLEKQDRRARPTLRVLQADDLQRQARHLLRPDPVGRLLQDGVEVAVGRPVGIKSR